MQIAARKAFCTALTNLVGEVRDSDSPAGGDLFVFPSNKKQQEDLLGLNGQLVADRLVTCSLPKSTGFQHKGVIFGVPLTDSEADLMTALADQNVIDVQRMRKLADNNNPTSTVFLYFSSEIPDRVKIASVSYPVRRYIPTPYRCRDCWRLGHTQTNCNNSKVCKKCGRNHSSDFQCVTRCVNCNSPDHESDSNICPSFLEMKAILRMAVIENIPVQVARQKYGAQYSRVVKYPSTTSSSRPPAISPTQSSSSATEFLSIKAQIVAMQAEIKQVTDKSIPQMALAIRKLGADLATKQQKMDHFDERFDRLETLITGFFRVNNQPQSPPLTNAKLPGDNPLLSTGNSLSPLPLCSRNLLNQHNFVDDSWDDNNGMIDDST